uniref:Rho-GAP domain-containing protein n=2 Tax=Amorphochlora amoebiformis TaxID=1561963 RepID=A0A7S0D799_9EUKA|mmetsp:Transcript_20863/g.33021  ORF Transcript_20863/g.33021 Transcript_20863/m.33021 type:complete len:852 (+) Transcript_20863:107-2662(+)
MKSPRRKDSLVLARNGNVRARALRRQQTTPTRSSPISDESPFTWSRASNSYQSPEQGRYSLPSIDRDSSASITTALGGVRQSVRHSGFVRTLQVGAGSRGSMLRSDNEKQSKWQNKRRSIARGLNDLKVDVSDIGQRIGRQEVTRKKLLEDISKGPARSRLHHVDRMDGMTSDRSNSREKHLSPRSSRYVGRDKKSRSPSSSPSHRGLPYHDIELNDGTIVVNELMFRSVQRENEDLRLENELLNRRIQILEQQLQRRGVETKIDKVWEHQRFTASNGWSSMNLDSKDPVAWLAQDSKKHLLDALRARIVLPYQRMPDREWGYTAWRLEVSENTDCEGWQYGTTFQNEGKWHIETSLKRVCRRRKWIRRARDENNQSYNTHIRIKICKIEGPERPTVWNPVVKTILVNSEEENVMEKVTDAVQVAPNKICVFNDHNGLFSLSMGVLAAEHLRNSKLTFHLFNKTQKPQNYIGSAVVTIDTPELLCDSGSGSTSRSSAPHKTRRKRRTLSRVFMPKRSSVVPSMVVKDSCQSVEEGLEQTHTIPLSSGKKTSGYKLTVRILLRTRAYQEKEQFGKSIENPEVKRRKIKRYDSPLPIVLIQLKKALLKTEGALDTIGLFRLNASSRSRATIQRNLNLNNPVISIGEAPDFIAIAHLIKIFYLQLPTPILTQNNLDIFGSKGAEAAIASLPEPRKSLCLWLLDLAAITLKHKDQNKMHSKALGVCMGSVLVSHKQGADLPKRIKLSCAFLTKATELRFPLHSRPHSPVSNSSERAPRRFRAPGILKRERRSRSLYQLQLDVEPEEDEKASAEISRLGRAASSPQHSTSVLPGLDREPSVSYSRSEGLETSLSRL